MILKLNYIDNYIKCKWTVHFTDNTYIVRPYK